MMRARRRHDAKRQDGLVLQPGGAFLVDPVQVQSPSEDSTSGPDVPLSQGVTVGRPQAATESMTNAVVSSIVFGPNLAASMVAQTSAVGITTTLSATSSGTTTSMLTADSSSSPTGGPSEAFSTNAPSSTDSTSSTLTASSALPSAPFPPSIQSVKHTPTFIAAMAFLGIAAAACIIALIAYVLRLRHRQSPWGLGIHRDRDMEGRNGCSSGLSLLFEKPNTTFDTPKHSNASLSYAIPDLHRSFINSPGGRYPDAAKPKGPYPINSTESLQDPGQLLGPLQVKNYMKGDFTSSCDESSPYSPPRTRTSEPGTPQNIKPPFLSLAGKGLSMPWAEASSAADSCQGYTCPTLTDAVKDPVADVEGSWRVDESVPPLPTPPFDVNLPSVNEVSQSDGWGVALRTSIFNALSGLSANQSKLEDKYTTFPASESRSSDRWRNAMTSRRTSAIGREAINTAEDEVQDAWLSPKTIDHGLLFEQPSPVVIKSARSKQGLGIESDDTSGIHSLSKQIPPLVVRKKLPITKSRRRLHGESIKSRTIASRASSIYSPSPDSVKIPQRMLARGSIASQVHPGPRASGGCHDTVESAMSRSLTSSTRSPFLRRPTTGSVCSFSSEASELGAAELHVKQTLALRARRKRGMDMSTSFFRASPAAQCAMTADRNEVADSDD